MGREPRWWESLRNAGVWSAVGRDDAKNLEWASGTAPHWATVVNLTSSWGLSQSLVRAELLADVSRPTLIDPLNGHDRAVFNFQASDPAGEDAAAGVVVRGAPIGRKRHSVCVSADNNLTVGINPIDDAML